MAMATTIIILASISIILVVALVSLAVFYRCSNKEGFDDGVTTTGGDVDKNALLNDSGVALTTDACVSIDADGKPYVFQGVPYLRRHPTQLDKCVFVKTLDKKIMDSGLSACGDSSALFINSNNTDSSTSIITSIKKEDVEGSQQCVLMFKSGQPREVYDQFEKDLRERAIKQSSPYQKLDSELTALQDKRAALEALIAQQQRSVQAAVDLGNDRRAQKSTLATQLADVTAQVQQETAELARITDLANKESVNATALEKQANTKENEQRSVTTDQSSLRSKLDDANRASQTTSSVMQSLRDELAGVVRDVNNANSTISNLNAEINNYNAT